MSLVQLIRGHQDDAMCEEPVINVVMKRVTARLGAAEAHAKQVAEDGLQAQRRAEVRARHVAEAAKLQT